MKRIGPQILGGSRTLAPGIAIVIVVAMGVYSWLDGEAYRAAAEKAEQSRAAVERIESAVYLLVEAESGQRGYLLTADPVYLESYNQARPRIAQLEAAMRSAPSADPEDAVRLDDLIDAKLAEMAHTIEVRRSGDVEAALAIVRTQRGRVAMDRIRALATHVAEGENQQYRALTASALRHGYKTRILILGGAIMLALLLWFSNRRVNLLLGAQRQLIGDLDRSREQEARGKAALDAILRGIGDAVIATDTTGRIRFINRVAEHLTRWSSAQAEDRALNEVFRVFDEAGGAPAPDLSRRLLRQSGETAVSGSFLLEARDGGRIPVEYSGAPMHNAQGAATGVAIVFRDVTARRQLEEQLRQSQKLEAVGQLAGGIAHDFNNLLTVIEGYAEMMRSDLPEDSPWRDPTQEILVAAQRAASLTRQLLAFSRRQVLQPIRLNLNDNVTATLRMLARLLGENIEVLTRPAPGLWDVLADPGQIDQIIVNLAVNARDAMPHGGSLTIETANLELDAVEAAHFPEMSAGRWVRLSLTDTGHGMDARTRLRIFEPFFTTKEIGRGTGLGLSTVYGIVKQSGGHIQVESEPGMGATFSIFLPATLEPAVAAAPASAKSGLQVAGEVVLVVEDDDKVRSLVTSMLKSLGYRVLSPATPELALGMCADRAIEIDLLLTDMVLPHIDGIAVAQQVTLLRPGVKVLFMSGYTEHPVLQRPGVETRAFLHKPFTKSALAAKVREALESD
ncbi:MAG: CHASE3 domain-containing protein [Acidobacteria bacterium]|nr:CHASE3 domain-containing protein [Acidobacteriota bacterium]